jgi:hypothetical protein
MFLRHKLRRKDGKEHRYWSIVENRRVSGGRTVQRHVLYLGEINDSQRAAWKATLSMPLRLRCHVDVVGRRPTGSTEKLWFALC